MRVALYARVSSERQADRDLSIPSQLRAMREYATKKDWNVLHEFVDEAESARSANRPEFQRMISLARKKPPEFDLILVWKLSRFARNREDSILYKALLRKHGVQVVSISEPVDESPAGQLLEGVIEVIDEFYSANLSQDTLRGMKENARRGFCNGGNTPYGYRCVKVRVGNQNKSKLDIESVEADVVKRAFQMSLDGLGLIEIAKRLNEEGITTRAGHTWGKTVIHYLLTNEAYTGTLVFNRQKYRGARIRNRVVGDPVRVENAHPAIVDKQTFAQVQKLFHERSPTITHPRMLTSHYLLSGMLFCGFSEARMVGCSAKSGRFFYYGCQNSVKKSKRGCRAKLIPKGKLEAAVLQQLKRRVLTEENLVSLVRLVNEELAQVSQGSKRSLHEIRTRIEDLRTRLHKLYGALETGRLSVEDLAPRIKELRSQIQDLEAQKNEMNSQIDRPMKFDRSAIKHFANDLQSLLLSASILEKRGFLRSFIRRIVVPQKPQDDLSEGTIEYTLPPISGSGKEHPGGGEVKNPTAVEVLSSVRVGSPGRTRTCDQPVNSRLLYQLSYRGIQVS